MTTPKLFSNFNKAPHSSSLGDILTSRIPTYSEQHRQDAEIVSVEALKKVLAISDRRGKVGKKGG